MYKRQVYNIKTVLLLPPVSINNAAKTTPWITMKAYDHCTFKIITGSAAAAVAVTLSQAKNVDGNGAKSLAFTKRWYMRYFDSPVEVTDEWAEAAVSSNTFNVDNDEISAIEVRAAELDVDNGFDCVRVNLSAVSGANVTCIIAELARSRYSGDGRKVMPSAYVN